MTDKQQAGPDLSVVIITKNEEEMIKDCIESTLSALEYAKEERILETYEVILSDSASTDRTIEIAKHYPIKIVQLNKNWPLSAPAGRYIGYLYTNGKYIAFTDGDCVLDKAWFTVALPYLKDENVAAVDGIEREHVSSDDSFSKLVAAADNDEQLGAVTEEEYVGKAIFKRAVLKEVGCYNPYLKGGEEREISYRITDAGYKLLRLHLPCVTHHWAKKGGKLTLKSYLKSVYVWCKGEGQAMRYSINNKKVVHKYLKRYITTFYIKIYGTIFLFISLIYMNILTFLIVTQTPILLSFTIFIDAILSGLGAIYAFIRHKGGKWKEFLYSFHVVPYALIRHIGLVIGFLKRPKSPSTYPTDVKIIKEY